MRIDISNRIGTTSNFGGFRGLLDKFSGAAAAYSLRKLSKATTSVVRVRRDSDNAEADFTALEITDGTLAAWVNTDVVVRSLDATSGNEDLNEENGIGTDGETIAGVSDAYKFTLSGGSVFHSARYINILDTTQTYRVTFDYYIPSSNIAVDGIYYFSGVGSNELFNTLDQWVTVTKEGSCTGDDFWIRATDGGFTTVNADGDVFYLKNIVITQTTSDGLVTTWYDQSGNGNDATQGTAAYQPKIVDAGVLVTENGKPSISFDGTDDFLAGLNLTVNSAFSVLTTPDIGSNVEPLLSGASRWFSFSDTNSHYYSSQFNYSSIYTGLTLGSAYYDGSNAYMFMNGDASADNPQSTTLLTNVDEIGRYSTGNFFNEKVLEIIIYPTDQSSNRTAIEGNINGHYNIYP